MLKIVPTKDGVNITFNGTPIPISTLMIKDVLMEKLISTIKSIRYGLDNNGIAYFEYESRIIRFFRHFDNNKQQDVLVYVERFPIELMEYLNQIEVAILREMPPALIAKGNETTVSM